MSSRSSSLSAEPEVFPSTNPHAGPGMGAVLSSWKGKGRAGADETTETGPILPDEVIRVANEASISSLASQVAADGQLIKSRLLRAGHKFIVEVAKAPYDRADQKRIWEIFKENMSASYKVSSFGWTPQAKKQELFHPDSRYIILRADRHTSAEPEAVKEEETAREPDLGSDEVVDELLVMERKVPVQSVEAVEPHSKDASEGSTPFTTAPPSLSKVQPAFAPSILVDETLRASADDKLVPSKVFPPHHPLNALLSNPYLPPPVQRDPLNITNITSFINDSDCKSAPSDILPLAAVQPNPMVTPTTSLETFQTAVTSPAKPCPLAVAARYPFSLLSSTPPPPAPPPPTPVASATPTLDLSPQAERPAAKRRKVIHPAGERRRSSRPGSSPLKPDHTETEDWKPGRSILSSPFVKVSIGTSSRLQTTPAQKPRLQPTRSSARLTPSTQAPPVERQTPVSALKSHLAVAVSSPVGTDGLPTPKRRGRPPKNAPSATTPTLSLDQPIRKKLGRPRKASVQRRLEAEAKALELAQELERVERERRRKEREREEAEMERARAGTVEGYLMWRFDTELDEDGEEEPIVYLYELSVSQEFQRAGLGRYLVSRIEDVGRAWGCRKVMLTVLKSNVKAINFYRKMGYEIDHSSPSRFTWSDSEDDHEAEQAAAGAEPTMDIPPSSTSPLSPSTHPPPPPPLPESGMDSQEVSGMLWIGGTWRKVKYDYEIMSKVILSPNPVRSPLAHSHLPSLTNLPSTPATQPPRATTSTQKMRLRRRPTAEDDMHLSLARVGRSSPVKPSSPVTSPARETPVVSTSAREGLGGGENGNKKRRKKEAKVVEEVRLLTPGTRKGLRERA